MKKQIFTIILLLMSGIVSLGQFKLDGGVNSLRLQTNGVDRLYIAPNGVTVPAGNVGIGTFLPPAKLSVVGDMALQKIQRETVNGGYNNYDRQDASIAIFQNGGTLTGIQSASEGQLLYVLCGFGNNPATLTIAHESASSTASNRILTHTGTDVTIPATAGGGVLMIYDATKARWRIVETPSGTSTAGWGLTGNAGTNPSTQFIGTTDAQPLAFKTNNVEKMRIASNGNVGIGATTPNATLDVFGEIALSKRITNNGATGTINNLNTQGASVHKYTSNSNISLTGIAGGTEGKIIILICTSTSTIVLKHLNTDSFLSNRIFTNTGADISITSGSATLMYDEDASLWRVIATSL